MSEDFSNVVRQLRAQDHLAKPAGWHPTEWEAFASDSAGSAVGWDRAFLEMEEDDEREQAFAVTLGFKDASEYHTETNWCDRMGLSVDWYESEDLRP